MTYPNWLAGQTITAALLNSGKPEYVTNSGGAQTNATTTLADATGLGFAVEAGAVYFIQARISFDSPAATDAKAAWTVPSGATMGRNIITLDDSTTSNLDSNVAMVRRGNATAQTIGGQNGGGGAPTPTAFSVHLEDIYLTTVDAGTVQFQFASVAAGTTTLQADSLIIYTRIA